MSDNKIRIYRRDNDAARFFIEHIDNDGEVRIDIVDANGDVMWFLLTIREDGVVIFEYPPEHIISAANLDLSVFRTRCYG